MDHYDDDINARSRWLKIGGGVLAGVVLLAAGFGVGRLSAPSSTVGQRPTVAGQSGPGPTRVENGVPVGYAHTPEGAVAAATNFIVVQNGPLITQPDKYRVAIDTLAAPSFRPTLRSQAEKSLAFEDSVGVISSAQQGRAVAFRIVPLAYHVDRYDGGTARIAVWAESLVGIDGVLVTKEVWATAAYSVDWVTGDWRLSGEEPVSQGPVPVTSQPATQSLQFPSQLKDFQAYGYGPSR
jgi:hypothetical protein